MARPAGQVADDRGFDVHGSHIVTLTHCGRKGTQFFAWDAEGRTSDLASNDGGHGMLFTTFDGKLMMVLHSPNDREARPRLFEMEDTGETLKVTKEFTGTAS